MFVVCCGDGTKSRPFRYFHPNKGLKKEIKTAWALPETLRAQFKGKGLTTRTIPASPVAETMYPDCIQKNQIKWCKPTRLERFRAIEMTWTPLEIVKIAQNRSEMSGLSYTSVI